MKILLFAGLKQKVNQPSIHIDINEPITVEALKQFISESFEALNGEVYRVAVNEEFTNKDDIVHPNDVVALIPPVSGG